MAASTVVSVRRRAGWPSVAASLRLVRGVALLGVLMAGAPAQSAPAQPTPDYVITKSIALGAPDRWDYLTYDAASHRVFVAHGYRVTVVDGRDGAILGDIQGFPGGTHGVVVAGAAGRGYADDGKAGTVTSFDLKTLAPQRTIEAAPGADGIVLDRASGHVYVINGDAGSLTVVDPQSDARLATVDVGGDLEFGADDGRGKLYVNGVEKQEIVRIDTATNQVDARWPLRGCTRPHGIAVDASSRRVFASCVNSVLAVVDADTGAQLALVPIGAKSDAVAFDPKRKLVFSSNGDGTLSVIAERGPGEYVLLGNVATQVGARTMTLDPDSGRIYLVTADFAPAANAGTAGTPARTVVMPGSVRLLFLDPRK